MIAGLASSDYGSLVQQHTAKGGAFHATSNAVSVSCGRLSYTFGFRGPSMSVDTACSASLVGLHLAARGLSQGEAQLSYASGVHLQCTSNSTSYVWAASMLSTSGRCRALDASADGYVRGETCITTVLTTASAWKTCQSPGGAMALLGSAVNQDGRSSSLTAPNGPAQQEVIRAALASGSVEASSVTALSMHGTGMNISIFYILAQSKTAELSPRSHAALSGTPLGDPIEVSAAMAVLGGSRVPLTLAASKSWVGHAEPAAGLAGLLFGQSMLAQQMAHPLMHLRGVNPYVASTLGESGTSALLPKQSGGLPSTLQTSAMCGVSAFAFQGTNAHALVAVTNSSSITCLANAAWQLKRRYVLPAAHLFAAIGTVSGSAGKAQLLVQANLRVSQLAYLWDHKVMGKSVFPGRVGNNGLSAAAVFLCLNDFNTSVSPLQAPATLRWAAPCCALFWQIPKSSAR